LSFTPQADSLKPVKYRWEKIRSAFTGKPVDSRQVAAMSLPKRFALPLFGSDGISSVAYAADEIILMLAVAGNAAIVYAPWVGLAVAVVGLMIVGTYRYNINQVAAEGDFELVHRRLGRKTPGFFGGSVILCFRALGGRFHVVGGNIPGGTLPRITRSSQRHRNTAHHYFDRSVSARSTTHGKDSTLAALYFPRDPRRYAVHWNYQILDGCAC